MYIKTKPEWKPKPKTIMDILCTTFHSLCINKSTKVYKQCP